MIRLPAPLSRYLPALPRQRRGLFLVAVLVALVAWVAYDATLEDRPAPEAPPRRVLGPAAPPRPPGPGPVDPATEAAAQPVDIFAPRTWPTQVAQAPAAASGEPAAAAAPAEPEAPPLPFHYLGRVQEPGRGTVFFLGDEDERVLAVRPGDPIGPDYRVGQFRAGRLEFIYKPMNTQQFLAVGNA